MGVALLSIGTELTRGEISDTNAAWLGAMLTASGFRVDQIEVVSDDVDRIERALRRLTGEHALVIATGGLGPTSDDRTSEAAAKALGVERARDESALLAIRRKLEARGKVLTPAHEKMADLPRTAELLPNAVGTAPGFTLAFNGSASAFFLPGVPREMRRMFDEQVLPRIRPNAPNDTFQVRLRTYGLGEGMVASKLDGLEAAHPGTTLGYRVHAPEVDVKVIATAENPLAARELAARAAAEVRRRLGDVVYGEGDESFPEMVGRAVRSKGWRLGVAESCTGGLISHLLTSYPASDYLIAGAVTYANSAKTRLLGVAEDTMRGHGAVSAEVAAEMAQGMRRAADCELGISVTGIAGPSGGTSQKPVGLCFWAVAHPGGTIVRSRVFPGDRDEVQLAAAYAVLDLVRRVASGLDVEVDGPPDSREVPAPSPSVTGI